MRNEFERIYNEYSSGICGFLYKLCGSASLAEELTQETFYQAWKSLHRYNGSCELFTWLAAIAKNTYFKYLRKHKRELLRCELTELEGAVADADEQPEVLAEKRELREAVMRAVMNLSPKYRDVTVLRIYAELPFSAIAELLGITENSAKVIFHRAKRQLETDRDAHRPDVLMQCPILVHHEYIFVFKDFTGRQGRWNFYWHTRRLLIKNFRI